MALCWAELRPAVLYEARVDIGPSVPEPSTFICLFCPPRDRDTVTLLNVSVHKYRNNRDVAMS